jgi:hypothetical protein
MQMLIEDPQRRREMGDWSRSRVEAKYDCPRIIPRLVQDYEEVLGSEHATR